MAKIAEAEITFKLSWAVSDSAHSTAQLIDILDEASLNALEEAIQEAVGHTVVVELG